MEKKLSYHISAEDASFEIFTSKNRIHNKIDRLFNKPHPNASTMRVIVADEMRELHNLIIKGKE